MIKITTVSGSYRTNAPESSLVYYRLDEIASVQLDGRELSREEIEDLHSAMQDERDDIWLYGGREIET